jgi:hypothetical protein
VWGCVGRRSSSEARVRQPVRAHDLRATFVTIALALGKTETWISDRSPGRNLVHRGARRSRTQQARQQMRRGREP